jgi:DNA-binding beta-propeller fold protein YncE
MHVVPTNTPRRLAIASLVLVLAGCGSASAGASPASPVAFSDAPSGPAAATPSALATVAPTVAPTATPAPTGTPLPGLQLLWEKSGPSQPTPCCATWWPAIDPKTGNVWVSDAFASQFWIFTPAGDFVGSWGTPGKGDGQFDFNAHRSSPQAVGAIAFAPDGSFYVADDGNRRVEQFDASRHFVRALGTFGTGDGQFVSPFGIATDGTTVYVADDDRGDIQAFDRNGTFLRTFGTIDTDAGIFMAIAPDHTLYRAGPDTGQITQFDGQGTTLRTLTLDVPGAGIGGLAMGPNGHLYADVASDHAELPANRLFELDSSGAVVHAWSSGGETFVVAPDGSAVYAANLSPVWPTATLRKYALPAK